MPMSNCRVLQRNWSQSKDHLCKPRDAFIPMISIAEKTKRHHQPLCVPLINTADNSESAIRVLTMEKKVKAFLLGKLTYCLPISLEFFFTQIGFFSSSSNVTGLGQIFFGAVYWGSSSVSEATACTCMHADKWTCILPQICQIPGWGVVRSQHLKEQGHSHKIQTIQKHKHPQPTISLYLKTEFFWLKKSTPLFL